MRFLTYQIGKDQKSLPKVPILFLMFFGVQAWILFSFLFLRSARCLCPEHTVDTP